MRTRLATIVALACTMSLWAAAPQQPGHGRLFPPDLFPPEDLGILESPDRDHWQQPDRIMDALLIADGSRVADLGAGGGWFTIRLARRVGPNGKVYAEDIQREMIESIRRRVADHGLQDRVQPVLGTAENPSLPDKLDAVLIVDTYPQFSDPVTVLRHVARALAPNGRVGIVDFKQDGAGGPGPPRDERLDPAIILDDAREAGLKFLREETFLRYQYLLVFGR
jgi:ubiquinone/menaquinone biosynthesis C-methylase UbiE